jgi:hypothetical protein
MIFPKIDHTPKKKKKKNEQMKKEGKKIIKKHDVFVPQPTCMTNKP